MKSLVFCFLLFLKFQAQSEITYFFTGKLGGSGLGIYAAETAFSGSFSYPFPQPLNFVAPYYSNYINSKATISIGLENFEFVNLNSFLGITMQKADNGHFFNFKLPVNAVIGGENVYEFEIHFLDYNYKILFPDYNLIGDTMRFPPAYPIDVASVIFRSNTNGENRTSSGFVLNLVPEPSSLSLLLAGGAVLMAGRRKKQD